MSNSYTNCLFCYVFCFLFLSAGGYGAGSLAAAGLGGFLVGEMLGQRGGSSYQSVPSSSSYFTADTSGAGSWMPAESDGGGSGVFDAATD